MAYTIPGVAPRVRAVCATAFYLQNVVCCLWHPKLNQIVVGCVDGKAKVFFSPKHSLRYTALNSCLQPMKILMLNSVNQICQTVSTPLSLHPASDGDPVGQTLYKGH